MSKIKRQIERNARKSEASKARNAQMKDQRQELKEKKEKEARKNDPKRLQTYMTFFFVGAALAFVIFLILGQNAAWWLQLILLFAMMACVTMGMRYFTQLKDLRKQAKSN